MVSSMALAIAAFVTAAGDGSWRLPGFDGPSPPTISWFDLYPGPVDLILRLTYIVSIFAGVSWMVWQHRAQTNVWAVAGSERPRVSPGWAIGWWLVPFANWWMPLVAMRELYRGSTQTSGRRRPGGSATLAGWWALWLSAGAAATVSGVLLAITLFSKVVEAGTPSVVIGMREVDAAFQILGIGYVLRAASGVLAIALIGDIDRAQLAFPERDAAGALPIPPPPRPDTS